jgi:hypothetical protein
MTKSMSALDVHQAACRLAEELIKKKVEGVTGITKEEEDEWRALVEVLERKAVPDTQDMLGVYEFSLDDKGDLIGYRRVELRRRSDRSVVEDL